jgi:iron complex outermembrane recepter protein
MKAFNNTFRRALGLGVALAALAPGLAFGQDDSGANNPEGSGQVQSSQDAAVDRSAADQGVSADEIVVTGTILRGAPPVGSNLISVGEAKLQESGATTANELLASVPQVSNLFNTVPNSRLAVAANQIQVVRPNLRNLAGETSSSASTLVLFDGHRIASVGVTQNAVDPDLIPTIAIERVEVVTDGGSATYGSDAVGGVINFITRKRFDGLKVQAHYGFADDYEQYDAGAIIGKDWGSGSIFAAYNYQHNSPLFGRDRDFVRDVDFLTPGEPPRGRSCSPGNVSLDINPSPTVTDTRMFALNASGVPSATLGSFNGCDGSDDNSVVPESTRHGAIVGLHQELADWLTVDLRAFYGSRKSISYSPFRSSVTVSGVNQAAIDLRPIGIPFVIPASFRNFYYTPVAGQSATSNQTIFFTLAPVLGRNPARSISEFQEWGANAEFAAKLDDNWQLRTLFNYSRSNSEFHIDELSPTLLTAFGSGPNSGSAAGTINFYNPGSGAFDAANIAQLISNERAGQGKEELLDLRAILDGTLFTMPGGEVKVAVGYEYMYNNFRQRTQSEGPIGGLNSLAFATYDRRIHSLFGEVQVPLVGADNEMGFVHRLTLAGSVRYDHFSDFGSTINPKIGVNFKPVSWLGFRGNYSTSFNAPSPNDQLGALRNTAARFGLNAFVNPAHTGANQPSANGTVALQGSVSGLVPQEAETWSIGMDFDPPFLSGFRASINYYNVKFENIISIPTPGPGIFTNFPNNVIAVPSGVPFATIQTFLNNSGAQGAASTLAEVAAGCTNPASCSNVYELVDFRQGNYGTLKVQGLDFAVNYRTTTGFGGIDAGISGNYTLSRKSQSGAGAPVIDNLRAINQLQPNGTYLTSNGSSRLQLSATLGADIGSFRAQATLNHSSGYDLVRCDATTTPVCTPSTTGLPTAAGLPQDRVGAFNTVNLFFKYSVPGESMLLKDLDLTLNINNVFDTDPPIYRLVGGNTGSGYANGFTLGRLVQFGISKKF